MYYVSLRFCNSLHLSFIQEGGGIGHGMQTVLPFLARPLDHSSLQLSRLDEGRAAVMTQTCQTHAHTLYGVTFNDQRERGCCLLAGCKSWGTKI